MNTFCFFFLKLQYIRQCEHGNTIHVIKEVIQVSIATQGSIIIHGITYFQIIFPFFVLKNKNTPSWSALEWHVFNTYKSALKFTLQREWFYNQCTQQKLRVWLFSWKFMKKYIYIWIREIIKYQNLKMDVEFL